MNALPRSSPQPGPHALEIDLAELEVLLESSVRADEAPLAEAVTSGVPVYAGDATGDHFGVAAAKRSGITGAGGPA